MLSLSNHLLPSKGCIQRVSLSSFSSVKIGNLEIYLSFAETCKYVSMLKFVRMH